MKKINFNQPKYIIPTIAYVGLLLLGWLVIDLFNVEIKDDKPSDLQTTEYLNADLPTANVSADIGSKRKNVRDVYGNINDLSAIQDFVENTDTTIHKKEEFESKYSDEEKRLLEQNKQQQNEQCARNHHDSDSGAPFMRTLGWSFCGRSPADVTTVIRFDVIRKDVEIIVFV